MATTPDAVEDALAAAIVALTPTSLAGEPFKRYGGEKQFTQLAVDDQGHCFRTFDLRYFMPAAMPDHVNGSSGRWPFDFLLEVAYPRVHFKTLSTPRRAIRRARQEDFALIWPVLRETAGIVPQSATCVALESEPEPNPDEDADPVIFMKVRARYVIWINV